MRFPKRAKFQTSNVCAKLSSQTSLRPLALNSRAQTLSLFSTPVLTANFDETLNASFPPSPRNPVFRSGQSASASTRTIRRTALFPLPNGASGRFSSRKRPSSPSTPFFAPATPQRASIRAPVPRPIRADAKKPSHPEFDAFLGRQQLANAAKTARSNLQGAETRPPRFRIRPFPNRRQSAAAPPLLPRNGFQFRHKIHFPSIFGDSSAISSSVK